jgi:hypothetical protein
MHTPKHSICCCHARPDPFIRLRASRALSPESKNPLQRGQIFCRIRWPNLLLWAKKSAKKRTVGEDLQPVIRSPIDGRQYGRCDPCCPQVRRTSRPQPKHAKPDDDTIKG